MAEPRVACGTVALRDASALTMAASHNTMGAMTAVSRECVSTGFLVWCQTACARYIDQSHNNALKAELLPRILSGEGRAVALGLLYER